MNRPNLTIDEIGQIWYGHRYVGSLCSSSRRDLDHRAREWGIGLKRLAQAIDAHDAARAAEIREGDLARV